MGASEVSLNHLNKQGKVLRFAAAGAVFACITSAQAQVAGVNSVDGAQALGVSTPLGQGYGDDTISLLSPRPRAVARNDAPNRDYTGLPLGGWMFYPRFFVGGMYDDNVYQTSTNRTDAAGIRLVPSLVGDYASGVHKTTVYADGDFRIYPSYGSGDTTNLIAGFVHTWEVERDLTVRAQGEYARHTDMYNSGFLYSPTGSITTIASPQRYNTFFGSLSGVKSFDRFFVGLAGTVTGTTYDALDAANGVYTQSFSQTYRDNVVFTGSGRLGYAITPIVYAFTEAGGNTRSFNDSIYNSDGYRVVGGLGTTRIGLFRGEIYAGYQRQIYDTPGFGSPGSPVYGGRIFWYPTRAITLSASLDETYQDSGLLQSGNPTGSAAHVTTAALNASYAMARDWTASVHGGFSDVSYILGGRHDHLWSAGTTINYELRRNLLLTLDYTFTAGLSNTYGADYTRNVVSLGGTYKY